jgi:hypothetical protein
MAAAPCGRGCRPPDAVLLSLEAGALYHRHLQPAGFPSTVGARPAGLGLEQPSSSRNGGLTGRGAETSRGWSRGDGATARAGRKDRDPEATTASLEIGIGFHSLLLSFGL